MAVGPKNLLTDVPGLKVGNAEAPGIASGTTVILADRPIMASADVRGGAPGTRDLALLDPACLVDGIDAVVLSGGSAYGLAACDGVVDRLADAGRGFVVGPAHVPIVPGVILFDLWYGPEPNRRAKSYVELGAKAYDAAASVFELGSVGAGYGATCGEMKGGLGSASEVDVESGLVVGALVAVNAVGSAVIPGTNTFWAYALEQNGELGGQSAPKLPAGGLDLTAGSAPPAVGANTTIAVVATNAKLDKAACCRVAIMAHDGFARALRPVHTPYDGDSVIALATGEGPSEGGPALLDRVGRMAADCMARAIARGVFLAEGAYGVPSYQDLLAKA